MLQYDRFLQSIQSLVLGEEGAPNSIGNEGAKYVADGLNQNQVF